MSVFLGKRAGGVAVAGEVIPVKIENLEYTEKQVIFEMQVDLV
jgi:hypothetical protein